jgi:RNA polymerase sigma-70 factor (ECF subfamily)
MQRELVERAREGDQDAFAALARGSSDRLFALARLILGDSEAAADALQEALILAWRDIRALREPGAWDAWSTRLTVRACYRLAKQERRRTRLHRTPAHDDDPALAFETSPSILDRDEVERGFLTLDPDQRAVMVLHFYLGLPLTEVATILGIPSGTVKSRLHRGLVTMRASLSAGRASARPQPGGQSA